MLLTLRMNFTNNIVSPENLPSVEEVSFTPLEKAYLTVETITFGIIMGIIAVLGLVSFLIMDEPTEPLIVVSVVLGYIVFWIVVLAAIQISYKYSGYALREKDLLYRSGWLNRKTRIVMINRIQHISVQSGPLERKFGLASVSVFTAGSTAADFTIKGINEEIAQKIKSWISAETQEDGR